ncbi:lysine-specific permease [Obelidium mucronatum]|nr:lysine-specific permease [Obelidium mucronatum]
MDFDEFTSDDAIHSLPLKEHRDSAQTLAVPDAFEDPEKGRKAFSPNSSDAPAAPGPPNSKMHRKLQARHLEMIAIGGTIGTGLLLKSGGAIYSAGPLGALICYLTVGIQVFGVATSIGEMATFLPVDGAFSQLPSRFVNKAFGFVSGWNYWMNWALTIPAELAAIAAFMGYWISPTIVPAWVWSAVYLIPLASINMVGVAGFGEAEFVLSIIKVIAVLVFLSVGICVWLGVGGGGVLGFKNWNPAVVGETSADQFVNTAGAFVTAFFSYGGTELVGLTAGEAANPRKSVPRAINGTFYRVTIFYIGAIFVVGVLLPPNSEILNPANADRTSPFVYVYNAVGVSFGSHIMNAVVIIAALSAANSSIYATSRTLMRLAVEGNAPKVLGWVDKRGVPVFALLVSVCFGSLAVVGGYVAGTSHVFNFLSNFIAICILASWMSMNVTHLRFRYGYVHQGRRIQDLPYVAPFFPYADILSLSIGSVVMGFMVFGAFFGISEYNVDWFTSNSWVYGALPLMLTGFLAKGIVLKRNGVDAFKLIPYDEMDFETNKLVETAEEIAENEIIHQKPKTVKQFIQKVIYKLF